MGLIAKKSVMWLDGLLTFKAAPNLWRGEESWRLNQLPMANDVINHANVMACLCNGASIKTPKERACRASGLVNTWRFGENRWLQECMEAPHPFHMHLFNLVSPKLYPFIGSDGSLSAMKETRVWSLGWEDPLEKEMATHSSILAWKIPWMQEPARLQSVGSQGVRHNWTILLSCSVI